MKISTIENKIANGHTVVINGEQMAELIVKYYRFCELPLSKWAREELATAKKIVVVPAGEVATVERANGKKATMGLIGGVHTMRDTIKRAKELEAEQKALLKYVFNSGHQFNFNDVISGRIYTTAKGWHKMPEKIRLQALDLFKNWLSGDGMQWQTIERISLDNLPKQYGILGRLILQKSYNCNLVEVRYIAGQCQSTEVRMIKKIIKEEC